MEPSMYQNQYRENLSLFLSYILHDSVAKKLANEKLNCQTMSPVNVVGKL